MIDIEKETAERLEKEGVRKEFTFRLFSLGLITNQAAKRYLIIDEYKKTKPERGEKNYTRDKIADDFCVSFKTVKLYTAKK